MALRKFTTFFLCKTTGIFAKPLVCCIDGAITFGWILLFETAPGSRGSSKKSKTLCFVKPDALTLLHFSYCNIGSSPCCWCFQSFAVHLQEQVSRISIQVSYLVNTLLLCDCYWIACS